MRRALAAAQHRALGRAGGVNEVLDAAQGTDLHVVSLSIRSGP